MGRISLLDVEFVAGCEDVDFEVADRDGFFFGEIAHVRVGYEEAEDEDDGA